MEKFQLTDDNVSNNTNAQIQLAINTPYHTPFQISTPTFKISSFILSPSFTIRAFKLPPSFPLPSLLSFTASMIVWHLPNDSLMLITSFTTDKQGSEADEHRQISDKWVVTNAVKLLRSNLPSRSLRSLHSTDGELWQCNRSYQWNFVNPSWEHKQTMTSSWNISTRSRAAYEFEWHSSIFSQ